tara:strand:- start:161 stop:313 length:153 start_codon:yes stop_codon:yes gene_type:complete
MMRLLKRLLGIKPKPINYVWLNIVTNDRGIIGWSATNRNTPIKGEDNFQR